LILGQIIPAGTGSVGVHSDIVSKNGVETLAKAAMIDLDMNPGLVAHMTMDSLDKDRVNPKTGLMRPWTKRVKRVDKRELVKEIGQVANVVGDERNRGIIKKSLGNLFVHHRADETSGYMLAQLFGAKHMPLKDDHPRGRKRVAFADQDEPRKRHHDEAQ
jgi:hypothetical protein